MSTPQITHLTPSPSLSRENQLHRTESSLKQRGNLAQVIHSNAAFIANAASGVQNDPIQAAWEEIEKTTEDQLISGEKEMGGQIVSHNGKRGYIGSVGSTMAVCKEIEGRKDPVANRVGKSLTEDMIIATRAPLNIDDGVLLQTELLHGQGDVIVNLRHKDEIKPFEKISYQPIDQISTEIHDTQSVESQNLTNPSLLRYAFSHWTDGMTISTSQLDQLVSFVDQVMKKRRQTYPSARLWVHCFAGVGRTGTLITALLLKNEFLKPLQINRSRALNGCWIR